jgi:hypothetical protein
MENGRDIFLQKGLDRAGKSIARFCSRDAAVEQSQQKPPETLEV